MNNIMSNIGKSAASFLPNQSQPSPNAGPSQDLLAQLFPLIIQFQQMQQKRQAMNAPNRLSNSIFNGANRQTAMPQQAQPMNQSIFTDNSLTPQPQMNGFRNPNQVGQLQNIDTGEVITPRNSGIIPDRSNMRF